MALTTSKGWPRVLPADFGIRTGKPTQCFYCGSRVGQYHATTCESVLKVVLYDVLSDGTKVGTFERTEPHAWDIAMCEFDKNASSWCCDNALPTIKWLGTAFARKVKQYIDGLLGKEDCSCKTLEFRFAQVVDHGPLIHVSPV
jgi:hypothetical protein